MKIAIVGSGNVGGTLARRWADLGHSIVLGVRNESDQVAALTQHDGITPASLKDAVEDVEVIVVSTPPKAVVGLAELWGNLSGKVLIDTTNSVFEKPNPFATAYDAFKTKCNADVIKCFNTTGYENMNDPLYQGQAVDMFMAGGSEKAKGVASMLAAEIGFENCYDFGGDDKVQLIEQFAMSWINLALMQGNGRNMAFKILKR